MIKKGLTNPLHYRFFYSIVYSTVHNTVVSVYCYIQYSLVYSTVYIDGLFFDLPSINRKKGGSLLTHFAL